MTIGTRIQKLRKEKGLSQEDLAKMLLVSRQTISQWETDQTVPSIDNIYLLREVFDISFDELLSDKSNITNLEDQPIEEYHIAYQKEDIDAFSHLVNNKPIKRLIVFTALEIIVLIFLIITKAHLLVIGFFAGMLYISIIQLCKSISANRKAYKKSIAQTSQREYNYKIYDDHFVITIFDNDNLLGMNIIKRNEIKKLYENQKHYIFGRSEQELYIIKKDILKQNSILPSFFPRVMIQPKVQPQTKSGVQKRTKWSVLSLIISILLIVCSVASIFGAIICVGMASSSDPYSSTENMWLFFLFTPIPLASFIFGIYQNCKGIRNIRNIVVGVIMLAFLCIYGSFTFLFADTYSHDYQVVTQWEEQTGIDFPDTGEITTEDYSTGEQSGGYSLQTRSSIILDENNAQTFMNQIYRDEKWMDNLPTGLSGCVPFSMSGNYDYCLLYNLDTNEINKMPAESGNYHFVYFTYNHATKTLMIEEYFTEVII